MPCCSRLTSTGASPISNQRLRHNEIVLADPAADDAKRQQATIVSAEAMMRLVVAARRVNCCSNCTPTLKKPIAF